MDNQLKIVINAVDNASKEFAKISKAADKSFKEVATAVTVASGAIVAFSGKALVDFADVGEKFDNLSKSTGISIERLSAFQARTEAMGIPLDSVTTGIKKMQVTLDGVAKDGDKAKEMMSELGIKIGDIEKIKPEEQFIKIGNAIASIKNPSERTAMAVKYLGKSATELVPVFQDGTLSMEEMTESARKMGVLFDEEAVKKSAALDEAIDKLKGTMKGVEIQIASALAPVVSSLLDDILPVVQMVVKWIDQNEAVVQTIVEVAAAVLGLGAAIKALDFVGKVIFSLASPWGLFIVALGTGFLLMDNYLKSIGMTWGEFGQVVLTTLQKLYTDIQNGLSIIQEYWNTAWNNVVTVFDSVWPLIKSAVDVGWGMVQSVFKYIMDWLNTDAIQTFQKWFNDIGIILGNVLNLVKTHWDDFVVLWNSALAMIQASWDILWPTLKFIFDTGWGLLKSAINMALAIFKGDWFGALESAKTYFSVLWSAMKTIFDVGWSLIATGMANAWSGLVAGIDEMAYNATMSWNNFWNGLKTVVSGIFTWITDTVGSIMSTIQGAFNALRSLQGQTEQQKSSAAASASAASSLASYQAKRGTGKASGGFVEAGVTYPVGEDGVELFTPATNGWIIPNNMLSFAGGGAVFNINITGNTFMGEDDLSDKVEKSLLKRLKANIRL